MDAIAMTDEPPGNAYLLELFERFDANGDGLVDKTEFRRILHVLGDEPSDEVLSLEFTTIDSNGDGMVDFEEFRQWWLA